MKTWKLLSAIGIIWAVSGCHATYTEPADTLKDAYAESFMMGCAISPFEISGRMPEAEELLLKHFNALSPGNCLKA